MRHSYRKGAGHQAPRRLGICLWSGNRGWTFPSAEHKEALMGMDDKLRNMGQDAEGKVKEATGKATDNERLEAEGKVDQGSADLKQAGEKVKDAFKH